LSIELNGYEFWFSIEKLGDIKNLQSQVKMSSLAARDQMAPGWDGHFREPVSVQQLAISFQQQPAI
jgi:hypothetical protein